MKIKLKLLISATLIAVLSGCNSTTPPGSNPDTTQPAHQPEPANPVSTEIVIFKNDTMRMPEAGGYGYIIKVDGNAYIFQPTIPAVSGNKGFSSALQAEKTAGLVAYKLRNNINPPSVSLAELDSLGIDR
jgi:hypothetical protein